MIIYGFIPLTTLNEFFNCKGEAPSPDINCMDGVSAECFFLTGVGRAPCGYTVYVSMYTIKV